MTHSASLRRSVGRLSGISRISLRTSPQAWRRSTSFLVSDAFSKKQARAAIQNAGITFFIRTALGARASVIVVLPDNDARANDCDGDVHAVGERIQDVIEIVAAKVDIFGALWPEDGHFRAMFGDEKDIDALRIAFAIMMLAMMFAVLVLVIVLIVVVVVVTAALDNDGIRFDDLVPGLIVTRLIATSRRRGGLEPSQFSRIDGHRRNVEGKQRLRWEHDLLVSGEISAKRARSTTSCRADRGTLSASGRAANCRSECGSATDDQQVSLGLRVGFDGEVAGLNWERTRTPLRVAQAQSDDGGTLEPTRANHLRHASSDMRASVGDDAIAPDQR